MATVHLPRSLVTLFTDPPPRKLDIEAASLAELVGALDAGWPGMRDRLLEAGPRLREHINVFVNGERERDLGASLAADAEVHIIPAVAGGGTNTSDDRPWALAQDRAVRVSWHSASEGN
jgi:molybdopterin converting factor small subunit